MTTASNFRDALRMWFGAMIGGAGAVIVLVSIAADGPAASFPLKLLVTAFGVLLTIGGVKLFLKGHG